MSSIADRRLLAQGLVGPGLGSAVEVVRRLVAVQAQDYGGAKWALAQRVGPITSAEVDAVFDSGAILRTHVMRPTWHFALAEDLGWILELTSPRLLAGMAGHLRRLELEPLALDRGLDVLGAAVAGGRFLTRAELDGVLAADGMMTDSSRMNALLLVAEARGVIASGPRRGARHTYGLLAERAPGARRLGREEALAELTLRYFRSRGPAQARDFSWWAGLTMAEVRRGLALVGQELESEVVEGLEYWFDPSLSVAASGAERAVHLLPNFDEFTVAYRDRSAVIDGSIPFTASKFAYYQALSPEGAVLSNVVTVGGVVRGAWRRTLGSRAVEVSLGLLAPLPPPAMASVGDAVERFGRFLGRPAVLRVTDSGP